MCLVQDKTQIRWMFTHLSIAASCLIESSNDFLIILPNIIIQIIIIYIYIYICIFWQHFFIDTYLVKPNRHFLSTYFFANPFELPHWFYDIWGELVDKPSIISYFPKYFLLNSWLLSGEDVLQKWCNLYIHYYLVRMSVCTVVVNTTWYTSANTHSYKVLIHSPLIMAQGCAESTWEITNYTGFINQFLPNIIRAIEQFKGLTKKYVDKKCLWCSIKYIYIGIIQSS